VPNHTSAAIAREQMATTTATFSATVNGMERLINGSDLKRG
jgi:hypothetical protein